MGSLVSLVMTDIVGSTRRWNAAEGEMAADLETHDRLVAEVVEGVGGRVFKHTGDGMIAVFDDPVAAATAAAGIQRVIGSALWRQPEGLRVRAAVHTGVVYPRDGDLFGTAVNKVARLLGVCPPGAVLVSGATSALLADRGPEGLSLRRVGEVVLAGFATPDDIHALVGAGLATVERLMGDAPGDDGVPHRDGLPPIEAELVGRANELAAIWDALGRSPLVTLVGVGGMGKTRLALEIAAGAVAAYADSVWWVDLANATSAEAVLPVTMAAVGARESPGRTPVQALCDRFGGVTGLVVVDNCEHVLERAAEVVSALVNACPTMWVVCTSREALGLRREQIVPVGSLPGGDGMRLFCDRAAVVRPDLDLEANRPVIERICTRLDGIPLAIELAAARCRAMNPAEIDALLSDRFRLLRGGRGGAERHRTLQAAVAWSYSLLDAEERAVFDQMAVFAAGTLIDGLVAVTGRDRFDVIDLVDRLVARSMVVATDTPLGTRYHQLETLRQFAEDRLVEAGSIGAVRDRHLEWADRLAVQIGGAWGEAVELAARARFDAEIDNLRVAVAHAVGTDHHDTAHRMVAAVALRALWFQKPEVTDWPRPILVADGWTPEAAECAAYGAGADHSRGLGLLRAGTVDEVPDWYAVCPPRARISFVYTHLLSGGDWRVALQLLDRCPVPDDRTRLMVDYSRVLVAAFRRRLADSELDELLVLVDATIALARRLGSPTLLAVTLSMSTWSLARRRPDAAIACAREGADLATRVGAASIADTNLAGLSVALAASEPTIDTLQMVRDRAAASLARRNLNQAGWWSWGSVRAVGEVEPETAVRFWWVWQRDFGGDLRGFLDDVGIALPVDTDDLRARTATTSFADAVRAMLAAIDRWLAAAPLDPRGAG